MSARKPVEPGCTGDVFCPVDGHTTVRTRRDGHFAFSHAPLTQGQRKTLREARRAAWGLAREADR